MGKQAVEKTRQKKVTGVSRKTREEIVTWNYMTALRFQTEGRRQASPASSRGEHSELEHYKPMAYTNDALIKIYLLENESGNRGRSRTK